MLEAVILDNTERMLAGAGARSELSNSSNMIAAQSQMTCYGRDSKAATPFTELFNFVYAGIAAPAIWRSDVNNVLLVAAGISPFNVIAIDLTTNAMTLDSTGRWFNNITEDASGVVWANAANSGQYGLWKRTGAGAWTKVLADSAVGYLCMWIDNKIYYRSSVGNWYECTAGTVVLSADPLGIAGWYSVFTNSLSNDNVYCYPITSYPGYLTGLGKMSAVPGYSAYKNEAARYWPISAAGQYTGVKIAPLGEMNWEFLSELTQPNALNVASDALSASSYAAQHRFIRLDNTYMLHSCAMNLNGASATRLPNQGMRKIALNLLNKTTKVNKFVGSIYLTSSSTVGISATTPALMYGNIIGAQLTSGVLDLWIAQGTYTTNTSTDIYGLFKKSLTLNLDF